MFGGLYHVLKRNGFAFLMVISTVIVSKFWHNTRSDFIIDRVSNKYRYSTTIAVPIFMN